MLEKSNRLLHNSIATLSRGLENLCPPSHTCTSQWHVPPPCSKLDHTLALYPLWCPWHELQEWTLVYWIHMPLIGCIRYNLQFDCCPIPFFIFSHLGQSFTNMSLWLLVATLCKMSVKTNHMVSASSMHWVASSCSWPSVQHVCMVFHVSTSHLLVDITMPRSCSCSWPVYSLPSTLINWCWCNMHEWVGQARCLLWLFESSRKLNLHQLLLLCTCTHCYNLKSAEAMNSSSSNEPTPIRSTTLPENKLRHCHVNTTNPCTSQLLLL